MRGRRIRRGVASGVAAALLSLLSPPAQADFVRANLRHTLYHEVGHAVIDQMDVALHGPEEAAADGFAVFLAHLLMTEDDLRAHMTAVVGLGRIEAEDEFFDPWYDYMPGAQRLAWAICLYYGLASDAREGHARALGLATGRMDACREAGDRLARAWAPVFDAMAGGDWPDRTFRARRGAKALRLLGVDIAAVDALVHLPRPVALFEERCGHDNAYYYPDSDRIAFCREMLPTLRGYRGD